MSYHAKVTAEGKLELPVDLLEDAGIAAGERVVIDHDERGRLIVRTFEKVVREGQDYFRSLVPEGVSLVDELIADRRAEAAREDAELEEWRRSRGLT